MSLLEVQILIQHVNITCVYGFMGQLRDALHLNYLSEFHWWEYGGAYSHGPAPSARCGRGLNVTFSTGAWRIWVGVLRVRWHFFSLRNASRLHCDGGRRADSRFCHLSSGSRRQHSGPSSQRRFFASQHLLLINTQTKINKYVSLTPTSIILNLSNAHELP